MDNKISSLRNGRGHGKTGPTINILASLVVMGSLGACGGGGGNNFGGGGGGGGTTTGWTPGVFLAASTFAGTCANPRAGTSDIQGTSTDENNFLRSYSDNTYLWYSEITDRDPSLFTTPDYFDGLVSSVVGKDRFHFWIPTDEWNALSQSGISVGYGAQFAILQPAPPRQILVAYTDPNTPATTAGLARGAEILEVDGVDIINGDDLDTLNGALFPSTVDESHEFTVRDFGSQTNRTFTMLSAELTSPPVPIAKTIPTLSGDVGYILFNSHIATSERALFDAITELEAANIVDLIIDLRYNGGGFLDIASEFSYMIAGNVPTAGRTFEILGFNDKHPITDPVTGIDIAPILFHTQSRGFDPSLNSGTPLPFLNLSRVFVLTGPGTCSASESIINSLRGIDFEVIQIGTTTCGKPYGFYPTPNCGTHYFTIQFQGENDKGFGDYPDGFSPNDVAQPSGVPIVGCTVGDDFSQSLGSPVERRLAAAITYAETGACPPVSGVALPGLPKPGFSTDDDLVIPKSPWQQNRILRR